MFECSVLSHLEKNVFHQYEFEDSQYKNHNEQNRNEESQPLKSNGKIKCLLYSIFRNGAIKRK